MLDDRRLPKETARDRFRLVLAAAAWAALASATATSAFAIRIKFRMAPRTAMRSSGRATFRVDCGTAILEELRLGRHVDVLVTYAAVQRQHPYLVHVGIAVPDDARSR